VITAAVLCRGCTGRPISLTCDAVGTHASPATADERWLLGLASRYPADGTLAARADELHRSQRARRAAAWEVVARTLAPISLAHRTGLDGATVPRFRTWYDRQDVYRVFGDLYGGLGPGERTARTRFTDAALDAAFGLDVNFVTTLPGWSEDRLQSYALGLDRASAVAAIGGVQRIAISPDAARHVVSSYPEILNCLANGAPPAFDDGAAATDQQLAREPLVMSGCDAQSSGPYFVARGGRLHASVIGEGADTTDVSVVEGATAEGAQRCIGLGPAGCDVTGPGIFRVRVNTRGAGLRGTLDVQYTPPSADVAACLHGVFPLASATVAEEWRRADIGIAFPYYDTSAAGLARRLAPGAEGTWGEGDGTADPSATEVYTMQLASGGVFRLAGMHIRTREVDHWMNVTLWWSPTPDEDFGADRSDSVRALGAPWTSYKMCVATDFDEQDVDPRGGYDTSAPSLGAALAVVHEGAGGPSWCSNPYIDAGPGLVRSNCVGCHQHAMSGLRPGEIQMDPVHYPGNGRMQVRNNFPADQFWGIDEGDQLGAVISDIVSHYDANP
jgi:hypothetical protein